MNPFHTIEHLMFGNPGHDQSGGYSKFIYYVHDKRHSKILVWLLSLGEGHGGRTPDLIYNTEAQMWEEPFNKEETNAVGEEQ